VYEWRYVNTLSFLSFLFQNRWTGKGTGWSMEKERKWRVFI